MKKFQNVLTGELAPDQAATLKEHMAASREMIAVHVGPVTTGTEPFPERKGVPPIMTYRGTLVVSEPMHRTRGEELAEALSSERRNLDVPPLRRMHIETLKSRLCELEGVFERLKVAAEDFESLHAKAYRLDTDIAALCDELTK